MGWSEEKQKTQGDHNRKDFVTSFIKSRRRSQLSHAVRSGHAVPRISFSSSSMKGQDRTIQNDPGSQALSWFASLRP